MDEKLIHTNNRTFISARVIELIPLNLLQSSTQVNSYGRNVQQIKTSLRKEFIIQRCYSHTKQSQYAAVIV